MDHGEFLKFNRNTVIHSSNGEARIGPSGALRVLLPPPAPDPSLFVPKLVGLRGLHRICRGSRVWGIKCS
jgi:hypothetical protein